MLINGFPVQADDEYDIRAADYFVQIALVSLDGLIGAMGPLDDVHEPGGRGH